MELSEQEKLLRLLAEALGSVKKETSDLTNMNSRLKSAEEAVAKAILNSNVGLIEAKKQYKEANDAKIKYNKAIKEAIGEMEKELSATDKIKKAQENLAKAYKSNTSEIAKYKSEIQSLRKEQEKEDEILKKVIRDTQTSKEKLLEFSKSVGGLTGSFKSSIAPIAGFIANLGAGTMSFNNIVTAGLRYNQLMFNVSRAQMVAGQSSKDLSSSIDGIAKTTNLSTVQFLEFAETIQKGFIGIRPTLQDTAKLSNQLASQIGPSFEAQKNASQNLISIQSKFPSLYSKIREGMDLVEKINSGNGGEADKQRLSALQSQVLMIQQLSGASNEEKMMSLQLTTEVTDAQKELNRTQAEAQKLSKAMGEAQKEMWKSLQPAILKATELVTKFINFASDNKEVVIAIGGIALALGGITVAATIARDAMLLFGAASGPIGWISLAVAAIGTGILKWQANTRKAKEEAEKQQQVMKAEANIQNQINNLSTKQQEEFKKLYTDKKLDQKNGEERRAIELEILSGFQKQTSEAKNLTLQMDAVTQDTEQQLGLIDKMTAGYQATANAASQFGMVNNNALQGLVKSAQLGIDAADNAVKKRMQSIQQVYQKQGISIPISMELDTKGQSENMVEILSKLAKQTTDLDKQKEIYSAITSLQNESVQLTNRTADMSKKKLDADMAGVKQMEEQTSAYEARLNTERQLMESAQFGMGASVSMMQKQVDLAYENIKTLKETETRMQNRLVLEGKVSKEQLLQIQNAKTAGQAQKIIEGIAGNNVQLQYDLNAYATQH
ncbi:MAG: hypothetical protein RLY43_571, partial [Bacteroidota bacterium]